MNYTLFITFYLSLSFPKVDMYMFLFAEFLGNQTLIKGNTRNKLMHYLAISNLSSQAGFISE